MSMDALSDYGSAQSVDLSWSRNELWQWQQTRSAKRPRPSSFLDLMVPSPMDKMEEFRANGTDSPYCDDDRTLAHRAEALSGGSGRLRALRQLSCPEPRARPVSWVPSPTAAEFVPGSRPYRHFNMETEEFPNYKLPKTEPCDELEKQIDNFCRLSLDEHPFGTASKDLGYTSEFATSTPIDEGFGSGPVTLRPIRAAGVDSRVHYKQYDAQEAVESTLTPLQVSVLRSLPQKAVHALLDQLRAARDVRLEPQPATGDSKQRHNECRFCKNNGERQAFYQSHVLKDVRGHVTCPVLRAYTCSRCGATGRRAHTIKYCPKATPEDRQKSAAMMRSVRMASGRRRTQSQDMQDQYIFGEPNAEFNASTQHRMSLPPLDPSWAELARKLSAL